MSSVFSPFFGMRIDKTRNLKSETEVISGNQTGIFKREISYIGIEIVKRCVRFVNRLYFSLSFYEIKQLKKM